jgi:hypothetical protein
VAVSEEVTIEMFVSMGSRLTILIARNAFLARILGKVIS